MAASRLVQFMGAQPRPGSRRIRLYGISLVQQTLVVNILEKIPQCLDITVVVCDVRIVHIDPIPYPVRQSHPFLGVLHHLLAAGIVVVLDTDFRPDVLLRDAEHLLHTELYRETVGVPAGPPVHLVSALGLVPANGILDGTSHDMMYARHAVGRRRSFEKDKFRSPLPQFQRFGESIPFLPPVHYLISSGH